jgi:serine/threonine protein phosphatase PrpC
MISIASKKHIGAREDQQDSVIIQKNSDDVFIALGDGMGGHTGGAKASNILVTNAQNEFERLEYSNPQDFFNGIVEKSQEDISIYQEQSGEDPHTTVTFALLKDNKVHYANIGDSRVYIFEEDKLLTRSRDHSVPEMLFQQGEIEEEEMATHPDQNKLTKSLGAQKAVKPTYKSIEIDPKKNYIILVCSDGFWEYVTQKEMVHWIYEQDLDRALSGLIEIARKRGGDKGDNISVGVAKVIQHKVKKSNKLYYSTLLTIVIGIISLVFYLLPNDSIQAKKIPQEAVKKELKNKPIKEKGKDNNKNTTGVKTITKTDKVIKENSNNLDFKHSEKHKQQTDK